MNEAAKTFRRGQIEWALAQVLQETVGPCDSAPSAALLLDLKRLLNIDRKVRVDANSEFRALQRFAFYSDTPPGSGTDLAYSFHDALRIFVGLKLLGTALPQSAAVRFIREVRPALDRAATRLWAQLQSRVGQADVSYLVLTASHGAGAMFVHENGELVSANFAHTDEQLLVRIAKLSKIGDPIIVFEIGRPASQLFAALKEAPIRKRGRQ